MRKLKFIIGITLVICTSGCGSECIDCGCDDCEDFGIGNLELIRDWGNLWQDTQKTEEVDVYLYHPTLAPWYKCTYTDTSYHVVPAGNYQVVAASKSGAVLFQGMDNYYTAEVCLPTQIVDSVLMVSEAPLNLIDQTSIHVETDRKVRCTVTPTPFVKVINFRVHINRHGDVKEIVECNGRLNGVLTSTKICVKQDVWFSANMDFSTIKESSDEFFKTVTLLGMNPSMSHKLKLLLTDVDGICKELEVDVTGKLNFSKAPILNCIIQINLTGTDAQVGIMDWLPGIIEDIVLQ